MSTGIHRFSGLAGEVVSGWLSSHDGFKANLFSKANMHCIKSVIGSIGLAVLFAGITCCNGYSPPQADDLTNADTKEFWTKAEPEWGGLAVRQTGTELEDASMVVVLLHGFGTNALDLVGLGEAIKSPEKTCFIFPSAPNKLAGGRLAWWTRPDQYQESRDKVVALLKDIHERNDRAKIVLGGFSQGAILSSNFLDADSNLVSALVLLSPSGQLRSEMTGKLDRKPKVFLAHGRTDQILPFDGSERLYERLQEFEYQVDWLPFDGAHSIPEKVINGVSDFLGDIE